MMAGEHIRLYYKTSLKLAGSSTLYISILGYSATVRRVFTSVLIQLQVLTCMMAGSFRYYYKMPTSTDRPIISPIIMIVSYTLFDGIVSYEFNIELMISTRSREASITSSSVFTYM